jgi:predicted acylesterase/phospholipase RssA
VSLALVLSGGGACAAYFGAGVAQGLAEEGLRPDVLSGTSAGGLNVGRRRVAGAAGGAVDLRAGA